MSAASPRVLAATWFVLVFFLVTTWFDWSWPSGVFFVWLSVRGVLDRQTFLVSPIGREENPKTYWALVVMWAWFGLLSIGVDVAKFLE